MTVRVATVLLALTTAAHASPDDDIKIATSPLPPQLRAAATVVRFTARGGHELVRKGTGPLVCFRVEPGEAAIDARCYHQDFMPLVYRAKELQAAKADVNKTIDAEVKAGKLALPKHATVGYRILGKSLDDGEVWQSLHMPYASADDFGVVDMANLPDSEQKWVPYSMATGTWWAHFMIEHPVRK